MAQGVEERICFHVSPARVAGPCGGIQPLERLGSVTPLRVDRGSLAGRDVAQPGLYFFQLRGRIGVPASFSYVIARHH